MRVSQIFGLQKTQFELDFVDIDPDSDTTLFLDPYYIAKSEFAFAINAHRTLRSFFSFLLNLLNQDKINQAREIFSYLGEPNETCLGFSENHPEGKGVGPTDTEKIFESLLQSKAVKTGLMEDIEDFRIFVPGIDKDKMSDMTTNIIRKHLIDYTQNQCRLWGMPLQANVPSGYYWARKKREWVNEYTEMLIINGKKILLVPKRIVSFSKVYTPQKYLQHFVLNFLQNEHLRLNTNLVQIKKYKSGREEPYVTKKSVKYSVGDIDKDWLAKFTQDHPEVFKDFRERSAKSLKVVLNEDIGDGTLCDIIQYLREKLLSIPSGNQDATMYHRTVIGILELLFYPSLSSPQVEREIHEGRKRIDITFDNSAERGFFFRLNSVYNTPSQFIMVECKNYSRDVENPELDQLSGRFSPNRGKFGLLLCRTINDMDLFLKRCSDTYKDDRGVIIPLVDQDLINMLEGFMEQGSQVWESLLMDRFRRIAL